ncbi:hypothetical protein VRU48_01840 [Pedobacter sp. KR3-3]|uniref:MORN repeat protein n=1 Tax=Pedobacter albus TaxID=3113905 RepID=A0ABU7I2Y6_9SPHI|nr:hypothetical protein [Pedobacter sp. KR3-3]MEE1943829.1 hypothetical protein [Pedobacter sp. KR3-3]
MKKIFLIIGLVTLLLVIIFLVINEGYYYRLLNKSGEIYKINSKGNFEGKSRIYKDGRKIFDGYFNNGKLEGLAHTYYDNGNIKSKTFYKNGIIEGFEYKYYQNGKVSFKGLWKNGIWYGSQLYFSETGKLNEYWVRDFRSMPNDFFYIFYNNGKIRKILGTVVSGNLAIYNKDIPIVLQNRHAYKDIEDLYVTVACPPHLKTSVRVQVNNKTYDIDSLTTNTLKASKAFEKPGKYLIKVFGILKDKDRVLKADTVTLDISKI